MRQGALAEATIVFDETVQSLIDKLPSTELNTFSIRDACDEIIDYRGKTPHLSDDGHIPYLTSISIKNGAIDWIVINRFFTQESFDAHMTRGFLS